MKLLSLIIPSYNCEKFLDKCLNSFIDEAVLDALDVIIVNDGSKDNTAAVAQKYCDMYPDSFRLISQENKGHGGALNTGCSAAKGKYLKVIDADDWVETSNLKEFVDKLGCCESDVVLTHNYTVNISNGQIKKWMSYPSAFDKEYSLSDIMQDWDSFSRSFTFHGITYKTSFYQRHGYKLSEKVFYEDHEFSTFPACFAKSVYPMDMFIYHYRIGDVEQSVSEKNSVARLSHSETVLKRFVREFNNISGDDCAKRFIAFKAKILFVSYITTALLVDSDRKRGRNNAKSIMQLFNSEMPSVYQMTRKKYKAFKIMHFLRIKKKTLDKMLNSKLYYKIKGTHNFD